MGMSAELLREAAAKMRERAKGATPGPWHDVPMGSEGSIVLNDGVTIRDARKPATCREFADAEHIASWHPAVALAVADLFDNEANAMDSEWREEFDLPTYNSARADLLMSIARTYLGGAS